MDKDAAKAMRKEAKRAEKMKRKEEKKLQKKLLKEQRKKLEVSQENEEHEEDGLETEDEEVEIVEDESGQCTVRIKPKPIKLKINLPKEMQDQSAATASGNLPTATGRWEKTLPCTNNISVVRTFSGFFVTTLYVYFSLEQTGGGGRLF